MGEGGKWGFLETGAGYVVGSVFLVIGNVLVSSSMYSLGVTGTYLGDYFGILMVKQTTSHY